ncbi:MAG: 3-dehydroquinate dehydratase [Betaproteobacteria bacterium]|nr:3-dehydroquinate dehydratase [Betaproteobacteria bacterium]
MEKILLVQGANMSFLGRREPEIYGKTTAAELDTMLLAHAKANKYQLDIFYTNIEGEAINRLYRAVDDGVQGLVMNPAGFNHAGYALRDCVRALPFPYVEVHMTNIEKREIRPLLASVAVGAVFGFGVHSYVLGLDAMLKLLRK